METQLSTGIGNKCKHGVLLINVCTDCLREKYEPQWEAQLQSANEKQYVGTGPVASLRDQFAMAALQGLLTDPEIGGSVDDVADFAYRYADAMISRRTKPQQSP